MTSSEVIDKPVDLGVSEPKNDKEFTEDQRAALRLADSQTISVIRKEGAALYALDVTAKDIVSRYRIPSSEVSDPEEQTEFVRSIFFKIAVHGLGKGLKTIRQKIAKRNTALPEKIRLTSEDLDSVFKLAETYLRLEHDNMAKDTRAGRDPTKPFIIVNEKQLWVIANEAISAIRTGNRPHLFVYAGRMIRVETDERGEPKIREINEDSLRGELVRLAEWIKTEIRKVDGEQTIIDIPVIPSRHVVRDILSLPQEEWGLPSLRGITACPVMRDDGSISDTSGGYDPQTEVYFHASADFYMPDIPDNPTPEDVAEALKLVEEVFVDFPFVDTGDDDKGASKANTIAALFTAVLRPNITGMVPCFLVDKPLRGTGASLLQRVIGVIAMGIEPPTMVLPKNEEEWEKKVFSILRSGKTIEIIDNVSGSLQSDVFASILTSPYPSNRILGQSVEITLPNRLFWMVNGNNVQIGGDLGRRLYYSRMDAQKAEPWSRDGFKHPDLIQWCLENRGRILAAIFTIARGWIQAGRNVPAATPVVGSFEEWRDTIAGILHHAGVSGFLMNAATLNAENDSELGEWETFLSVIYDIYPGQPWTASVLEKRLKQERTESVSDNHRLIDSLPGDLATAFSNQNASFTTSLGKQLSKRKDVRFPSGLILKKGRAKGKVVEWSVQKLNQDREAPDFPKKFEGRSTSSSSHDRDDTLDTQTELSTTAAPPGQTNGSSEPNTSSSTNSGGVDHPTDQQIVVESTEPPHIQQIVGVSGSEEGGFRGFVGFVPVQLTQEKKINRVRYTTKNNPVRNRAETTPPNPPSPHTKKLPDKTSLFGKWLLDKGITNIIAPETYSPITNYQFSGQDHHMRSCSVIGCDNPPSFNGDGWLFPLCNSHYREMMDVFNESKNEVADPDC